MHYIQSNWFVTNWLWLLLFLIGAVALVLYIGNRQILLKKSIVAFLSVFTITIIMSFYSPNFFSPKANAFALSEKAFDKMDVQKSTSFLANLIDYAIKIFSDKANNK